LLEKRGYEKGGAGEVWWISFYLGHLPASFCEGRSTGCGVSRMLKESASIGRPLFGLSGLSGFLVERN